MDVAGSRSDIAINFNHDSIAKLLRYAVHFELTLETASYQVPPSPRSLDLKIYYHLLYCGSLLLIKLCLWRVLVCASTGQNKGELEIGKEYCVLYSYQVNGKDLVYPFLTTCRILSIR